MDDSSFFLILLKTILFAHACILYVCPLRAWESARHVLLVSLECG